MTPVVLRKIETPLQRMVRRGGGVKVRVALAGAAANLETLEDSCRAELDLRLRPVMALLDRNPAARPPDDDLAEVMAQANAALTVCGVLKLPMLGRALIMLCALTDALRQTTCWPAGALTPAVNFVALARAGHIGDAAAETLLEELQRCLARYIGYSAHP